MRSISSKRNIVSLQLKFLMINFIRKKVFFFSTVSWCLFILLCNIGVFLHSKILVPITLRFWLTWVILFVSCPDVRPSIIFLQRQLVKTFEFPTQLFLWKNSYCKRFFDYFGSKHIWKCFSFFRLSFISLISSLNFTSLGWFFPL